MSFRTRFALLLFLPVFFPLLGQAQTTPTDIRPMLKSLTPAQKLQMLEYLRHLGTNIDDEIQRSYEQLSGKNRAQTVHLLESLKEKKPQNTLATVRWSADTLYFDNLPEGTPLLDSFRVTNLGQTPYIITGTETTCDCTVLKVPEHPVMPGETAVLRFEFDSSRKLGSATPAIILNDNSTPNKRTILYLRGTVVARKRLRKYPWED